MARPKKTFDERLTKCLPPARVTEKEYTNIQEKANAAGVKMSAYIRQACLQNNAMSDSVSRYDPALIQQLRHIGVNLNQQTRKLHATGQVPAELHQVWDRLEKLLDQMLSKS